MRRSLLAICLTLFFIGILSMSSAAADEAMDITQDCTITTSYTKFKKTMMTDGKYTTKWTSAESREPYIQVEMPAGVDCYGIYICFADQPSEWMLQTNVNGEWVTLYEMTDEYAHVYLSLYGVDNLRIAVEDTGSYQTIAVNEIFLLSQGDVPDWVQQWQPTEEEADIMFLVAHPDDELLFFGGAIPTYAVEQQRKVVVVYMTCSNTTRLSELLNGLWAMGVRNYPVIGDFYDSYTTSAEDTEDNWGKTKAMSFVVEAIRKYQPKVLVTHDFDGEYGHGAHKYTAELAALAYEAAADEEKYTESAELYGTWQVQKLYSHLYEENQITLDWSVPLQNMDGKTGLELASEAYALHVSQQSYDYSVETTGVEYDNTLFGLVYSEVGLDEIGNDFLENVLEHVDYVPAEELPEAETVESPEVEYADVLPELNEDGFLDEGEFVYENEVSGLWIYISSTLKVIIQRQVDLDEPLRWFECEIWSDVEAGEVFDSIQYDYDAIGEETVAATEIALKYNTVFALNTDYYTYRLGGVRRQGTVIRDGEIIVDDPYTDETDAFPNLDTLALFDDGTMEVYASYELTAEEYLEMGATDVYAFGPYLIKDGVINEDSDSWNDSTNPRCAIGMIEPGHYAVVIAEGRLSDSEGITLSHLAALMQNMGCEVAFNMDGGQTAVILFMGEQLNEIGAYDGKTSARDTSEILGIGFSDLVVALDDDDTEAEE